MSVHYTHRVFLTVSKFTMPLENLEEEGLEKNPNLELAQTKFLLSLPEHRNDHFLKTKLLDAIKADSEIAFFFLFAYYIISRGFNSRRHD